MGSLRVGNVMWSLAVMLCLCHYATNNAATGRGAVGLRMGEGI